MARVILVGDPRAGIPIGERFSIGRSPASRLQLADPWVSLDHAEIVRVSIGRYVLHDLGSRRGTFISVRAGRGTLISYTRIERHILVDDEVIYLGDPHGESRKLVFVLDDDERELPR